MFLALLVALPALVGVLTLLIDDVRIDLGLLIAAAAGHFGITAIMLAHSQTRALGSPSVLDQTALLFLAITSSLFLVVSLYTVQYVLHGTHGEQSAPQYFVPCLLWFLAAMTLVCIAQNLAVQWAAIEATTLASAPLVYFPKRKEALEAAWKYLLICSVGIALALLGLFFLGIAASTTQSQATSLNLRVLVQAAPTMSRPWLRAAFVLALVGYGTKMGLAPMHTWLPDTHSQAPSPVSALLSGCLLNCALLAILRFFQVCLAGGDVQFARTMLLGLGFLSMAVACAFMMGQRDYKRLFAYSSIENMGIIAIGFGLGGSATHGAIIHTVNHSICKAGLFMVAGNILREFGTTDAGQVQGLLRRLPVSGFVMMALLFAIGGAPPFGPFVSEWMIFQSAVNQSHPVAATAFVCLVALCFLGMASIVLPMLQGASATGKARVERRLSVAAPLTMLVASFVLGIYLPPFLTRLTNFAAGTFGG